MQVKSERHSNMLHTTHSKSTKWVILYHEYALHGTSREVSFKRDKYFVHFFYNQTTLLSSHTCAHKKKIYSPWYWRPKIPGSFPYWLTKHFKTKPPQNTQKTIAVNVWNNNDVHSDDQCDKITCCLEFYYSGTPQGRLLNDNPTESQYILSSMESLQLDCCVLWLWRLVVEGFHCTVTILSGILPHTQTLIWITIAMTHHTLKRPYQMTHFGTF